MTTAPITTLPAAARLSGTAVATVAAAAAAGAVSGWPGVATAVGVGAVVLAVGPRLADGPRRVRAAARWATGAAFVLPLGVAAFGWMRGGAAVPVELPLIAGCRNVLLGLAVTAADLRAWRRVAAVSLFVVLVASVRLPTATAVPLLAAYATAGCGWLATSRRPPDAASEGVGPAVIATGLVLAGTLAGAAAVAGTGVGATLRGFFPSSGGAGAGSALAASGLGNGPAEVPGSDHARSAGFDQSQAFMNSEKSGLYDAFLETAGEPLKKGTFEKLQMLRAKEIRWTATTGIEDFRGGRRFTLDRQPPPPPTVAAESHAADALLYVEGPLPVHLRAAAYDAFDGVAWTEAADGWPGHDLHDAAKADPWFAVGGTGGRAYKVRIGTLVGPTLPVPALAARFRLGRVVTARLLGWQSADVLRMRRAAVPPGTVLDVDCAPFDPARYPADDWINDLSSMRSTVGKIADPRLSRLARQWAAGLPRGWPQVAAVVAGLRERCRFDPGYRPADADAADRLAEFLFASRRGPDFLFASAAAVMLRELGYTTRLAGGFYAGPGDYDAKTGQAALAARAAHTWAEVRLPDRRWAVVEATPGYAVAGPDVPWVARAAVAARAHAAGLAGVVGLTVAAVVCRLRLVDAATAAVLWVRPGRTWSARATRTLRLIEFRARCAGRPRPPATTANRWLRATADAADVGRFADIVTWAAYGPDAAAVPWTAADAHTTCAAAARRLTATRIRRHRGRPA